MQLLGAHLRLDLDRRRDLDLRLDLEGGVGVLRRRREVERALFLQPNPARTQILCPGEELYGAMTDCVELGVLEAVQLQSLPWHATWAEQAPNACIREATGSSISGGLRPVHAALRNLKHFEAHTTSKGRTWGRRPWLWTRL